MKKIFKRLFFLHIKDKPQKNKYFIPESVAFKSNKYGMINENTIGPQGNGKAFKYNG